MPSMHGKPFMNKKDIAEAVTTLNRLAQVNWAYQIELDARNLGGQTVVKLYAPDGDVFRGRGIGLAQAIDDALRWVARSALARNLGPVESVEEEDA